MALSHTRIADRQSDIQAVGGSAETPIKVKYYEASSYYWLALSTVILNQTLYRGFLTIESGYMGLAPFTAQEGDMIYLLPDGERPFILRPVGSNEFHLVGQCYTHKLIYGGALPSSNGQHGSGPATNDNNSFQDIVLV
jgi:hypothetical protein